MKSLITYWLIKVFEKKERAINGLGGERDDDSVAAAVPQTQR